MKLTFANNIWTLTDNHNYSKAWFYQSPTANCQNMSILHADTFFSMSDASIKESFQLIKEKINKNQIIIDVHVAYVDTIKKYATKILTEQKYTNGTGTPMCLMIIKYF